MRKSQSLNGVWRYTPLTRVTITGDGSWATDTRDLPAPGEMQIPSHWERSGLPNFAGTVRFERAFTAPPAAQHESLWLVCRGVDYFASVQVNGHAAGSHEGYFQTWEIDITPYVQPGENRLAIDVTCPQEEPGTVWPDGKRMIKGILSHWDCRPGSWDLATGQDIHSGGIWSDVLLEVRPAVFIDQVDVQTWLTPGNEQLSQAFGFPSASVPPADVARVLITTRLAATVHVSGEPLRIEVRVGEHTARTSIPAGPSAAVAVETVLTIPQPRLWWTWDHGDPYLYPCAISLWQGDQLLDRHERMVGIRELALDPESGIWTLNRRRIFVRGTNITPTLWLGEYSSRQIDEDIALLTAAHINGVRMCVHVNREELYSALDRAGILVWQDFALQWGYQQTDAFIAEALRQIKDMVRQFRHHPCIALWCCQNESTQFNREVLDPLLAAAARQEDSSRYVRPTSEFHEHLYYGWYYGHLRDYLQVPTAAIISEFGAQALPSIEEMREIAGTAWPPDWRTMAYHDFQHDQTFHVAGINMGTGWEEFVEASQAYQATLLKTAIERFRRAKYQPVGSLFQFMFMDCWPSITWSVVSQGRRPKAGYSALQCAYQPVLVGALFDRDTWTGYVDLGSHFHFTNILLWIVNDRPIPYASARVTIVLRQLATGATTELATVRCDIPADSAITLPPTHLDLPANLPTGMYSLDLQLSSADEVLSTNGYRIHFISAHPALAGEGSGVPGSTDG